MRYHSPPVWVPRRFLDRQLTPCCGAILMYDYHKGTQQYLVAVSIALCIE
jgi:hypothetical protein